MTMCLVCESWYDEFPEIDSSYCLCCKNRFECSNYQKATWNEHADCSKFEYECPEGVEVSGD